MSADNKDRPGLSSKVLRHGEYSWRFDKADLAQGAYSLSDPDGRKVAVILPFNIMRPIDIPEENARLFLRDYGSEDWQEKGPLTLHQAIVHGSKHAARYRAASMMDNLRKHGRLVEPDASGHDREPEPER